jgi:hypothetical protein
MGAEPAAKGSRGVPSGTDTSASPATPLLDAAPLSSDMVESRLSSAVGDRARWAISAVEGRSGMEPRTSASILCLNSFTDRQAAPSCRATCGSLSGPSRITATTAMIRSFAGSRLNMCLQL